MTEDTLEGTCSTRGGDDTSISNFSQKTSKEENLEDLDTDGNIIL
jgi:hypothetical protein